jgi:hypothetical protein
MSPIRRARVQESRVVATMPYVLLATPTVVVAIKPVPIAPEDAIDDARSREPWAIPAAAVAVNV